MQANGFRKSAVALMMVAGGLAAAVSSYAPPAQAQASKGSQTAIPCNLTPKEKRARKKATIPCDTRKSAKKAAIPCDLSKGSKGRAIPCNGVRATKKGGGVQPCDSRTGKAGMKYGAPGKAGTKRGADKLGDIK